MHLCAPAVVDVVGTFVPAPWVSHLCCAHRVPCAPSPASPHHPAPSPACPPAWLSCDLDGLQERHTGGLHPDTGPSLVLTKRAFAVGYTSLHASTADYQASSGAVSPHGDTSDGGDEGAGAAAAAVAGPHSLSQSPLAIPDEELRRVGWVRMQDPLAEQPTERLFWWVLP